MSYYDNPVKKQTNPAVPRINPYFSSPLAKHCKTLTARGNQTISMPCFTSLGSTCHFGCRRGFFLVGDGEANCSLNSKGDDVSWNFGRFFVKVSFKIEPKKKNENQLWHVNEMT